MPDLNVTRALPSAGRRPTWQCKSAYADTSYSWDFNGTVHCGRRRSDEDGSSHLPSVSVQIKAANELAQIANVLKVRTQGFRLYARH